MPDSFSSHAGGQSAPASDASAVVPADGQDLPAVSRALYVGGAGTLRVTMLSGATVTLSGVQAGAVYPLRVRRVLATGTSATGIVALR